MSTLAKAVTAALRDADKAFPERSKLSDGTWGDLAHQQTNSDHNTGDAVDITHDPDHGADMNVLSEQAIIDPRVKYVIWNRRIYNAEVPALREQGWRPYTGTNAHDHHMHISVRADKRDDDSPWPWAYQGNEKTDLNAGSVKRLLAIVLGVSAGAAVAKLLARHVFGAP